jgi:hypothetical protein
VKGRTSVFFLFSNYLLTIQTVDKRIPEVPEVPEVPDPQKRSDSWKVKRGATLPALPATHKKHGVFETPFRNPEKKGL